MPPLPDEKSFVAKMAVPGYWDDHLDLLRTAPFWSLARFNPSYRKLEFPLGENPPDATLPYLMGVGWYRKVLSAAQDWSSGLVSLRVGGARVEAWVWLNGNLAGHHVGHSVPFEIALDKWLQPGGTNTLIIALDNTSEGREGCSFRGYQGRTAGLYRPVSLKITGSARIKSCYLRSHHELRKVLWTVELDGKDLGQELSLHWRIADPETGLTLGKGTRSEIGNILTWETDSLGMRPWSDHQPALYEVEVNLTKAGVVLDRHRQSFGLRLLDRNGIQLHLNGRPIMLRGGTDIYYFPATTMAPGDLETYRDRVRKLKELGFNWIRFHTWVPSEEYMQAADELGMMIQVEPPVGFREPEWIDIIRKCRTHPSVVLYCTGNEEYLDEDKITFLCKLAADVHREAPDALFNAHSALRGVEYDGFDGSNMGPGIVDKPFRHNPRRLDLLRNCSDAFGSFAWGMLSYTSAQGEWRELDERMRIYERPLLSHELGIHGNYLNLDLEHRYNGTRIGPDLYAAVRQNLARAGLLHRAELYYKNSCAWMKALRKETVEMARKVKYVAGYDLLGAFDQNWHRTGYPCGIMNEFLELKPGEGAGDVLKYNGENVLLLDCSNHRNFLAGDRMRFDVLASLFGEAPLVAGRLSWYLADQDGRALRRGTWPLQGIRNGVIEKVGTLDCAVPELGEPAKVTLFMELSGGEYEVVNNFDFWVFPKAEHPQTRAAADSNILGKIGSQYPDLRPIIASPQAGLWIVSTLGEDALAFLEQGGRVLLLGQEPFPALPTSFQMSTTGRVRGNLATVIEDHPVTRRFPHEGYCDWQFFSMLEHGSAVNFDELNVPFDPIIEVVSSFKLIIKQANLFEWKVGKGGLVVSTMNVDLSDPAAVYLLDRLIEYIQGEEFSPRNSVKSEIISELIRSKR